MNIRFAKEKDVPQIIALCAAHASYEKTKFKSDNKQELLSKHLFHSSNAIKCLVVELHNEIVGYATFMKQFSTWDACFYLYLDCLYLKEKVRGKGLGFQIMERLKEYAKSENCEVIQWQTPSFNSDAIDFYHKIGANSKSKQRFFLDI